MANKKSAKNPVTPPLPPPKPAPVTQVTLSAEVVQKGREFTAMEQGIKARIGDLQTQIFLLNNQWLASRNQLRVDILREVDQSGGDTSKDWGVDLERGVATLPVG